MKIIEKMSTMIDEELNDAKKYIKCAISHKAEMPETSDLFYKLSTEEMEHVHKLHDSVTEIITNYRKANGEPPADMLAVYNYLHNKQIEKAAEIKMLQNMYKESAV